MSGYTVAKTVALNVVDYDQAEKAWMTDIINKVTTSGMTPFEKMDAVSDYLTEPGRFKYVTVHGNYLVSLAAEPNTPFFCILSLGFLHITGSSFAILQS